MIVEEIITFNSEALEDARLIFGMDECDTIIRNEVLKKLKGFKLINFDNLKRRVDPNSFIPRMSFKLTYDDNIKCSDKDNIETLELEMVANNI